jgi:hypothetical protein
MSAQAMCDITMSGEKPHDGSAATVRASSSDRPRRLMPVST